MAQHPRLETEQDRALGALKKALPDAGFYLAGGTAVAWYLGHRVSHDLDLFSLEERADFSRLPQRLRRALPSVEGPHRFPIASLRDLAAMKLAAIASRGLRRDFWDLYEIL